VLFRAITALLDFLAAQQFVQFCAITALLDFLAAQQLVQFSAMSPSWFF